jgi:hypothetical protein
LDKTIFLQQQCALSVQHLVEIDQAGFVLLPRQQVGVLRSIDGFFQRFSLA